MSNFLLQDPDCVFIHIPKTAGTSIRKGVWESNYKGPHFGSIPEEWNGLFRFAFVRHPLQRLISAYSMFTEGAKGDTQWKFPNDARPLSIDSFFDIVVDETIIFDQRRKTFDEKIRHHTIPQTHPFNCLQMADFVGRFENFDADFNRVSQIVGINTAPPKIHVTTPRPWQTVLKGELLERCIDYYKDDLKALEYKT